MKDARVMLFDIEATSLEASFGHTLCFGYKYLGASTTKVISLADFPAPKMGDEPDANLLPAVHDLLTNKADIIITYYGKEYDRKFLNTRMLMVGLTPLPPLKTEHIDLYFTAKGNLKLHSHRLQSVSEALGCPMSKTPVRADTWRRAMRGDAKAMAYVIHHCKLDVDILEWCYMKLRPFIRQHPPRNANRNTCRVCDASAWQSKGLRYRYGQIDRRLQCQQCGAWMYENVATKKPVKA